MTETEVDSANNGQKDAGAPPLAIVRTNRPAFLGLLFGAVAILVAGLFGVMGILAIVFSAVGLSRSFRMELGRARSTARRRSIVGLVLGGISLLLTIVVIVALTIGSQLRLDEKLMESEIAKSSPLISKVKCPSNEPATVGRSFTCVVFAKGGGSIDVVATVTSDKGEISWRAP
ncbi:MAG: hypothetical protein QOD50_1850 [Actinomycetota bacterium]|nr:hypothetical protein [Actinomycetota bacterium]